MLAGLQGVQTQVMTSKLESTGQQTQAAGQLQHVFGIQKLGLGLSSQLQSGVLLCTGQLTYAKSITLSFTHTPIHSIIHAVKRKIFSQEVLAWYVLNQPADPEYTIVLHCAMYMLLLLGTSSALLNV